MSPDRIDVTIDIFTSRLRTLARLLAAAAMQWISAGRDAEALAALRLADDMYPLPFHVVLTCVQPKDFVSYLLHGPGAQTDPLQPDPATLRFADFVKLITSTIARLDAARGTDPGKLATSVGITLRDGQRIVLPDGAAYIDDWLMPNFYFHLMIVYGILRHAGVKIDKSDYMAHLASYASGAPGH